MNLPIPRYHPVGNAASPLHLAAAYGMEEVARFVISRGARINSRSSSGHTPIDEAQRNGRSSMVSLLLSAQVLHECR